MLKLFSPCRKKRVWDFKGGIRPPEMKSQSNGIPLRQIKLPNRFIIPLKQHIGENGKLCIKEGDSVLRGQPLTKGKNYMLPIHSPTSGKIIAIAPHLIAHPSSVSELCVIIDTDGEDRWIERDCWNDYRTRTKEKLIERICQYGIVGLGGAGFPTGIKLRNGRGKIETLIINAAECEPYITADDRLIQDCSEQIVEGIKILTHILEPKKVLIGIEDNKKQAIAMLRIALKGNHDISLNVIPTKYPSGSAKQLTQILTGKKIPHGQRSSDIGILMQNVSTVYAVKRAVVDGETLTERVVTITGKSISHPGNVWARLGTPVQHLLEQTGFRPNTNQIIIMGGPMMGFALSKLEVPIMKTTNCLLAPSEKEFGEPRKEKSCIRCGICSDVCPMNLLPQQLYWFIRTGQHEKSQTHNIMDCTECGACAWVCPSNIPLIKYFRKEKTEIDFISIEKKKSADTKVRFEARQKRLNQEKEERNNIKDLSSH